MGEVLALIASALALVSGVPGFFVARDDRRGDRAATALITSGALFGVVAIALSFALPSTGLHLRWSVPGGDFDVRIDALSAAFLLPVYVLGALASTYALAYWRADEHTENVRSVRFFFGVLIGSMGLLLIARNAVLFLMGWEGMALSAFFLVAAEHERDAVRDSGRLYLFATRIGTLCLFGLFALLHHATGSFAFATAPLHLSPAVADAAFLLAFVGFGIKAGLVPLHVWLPGAHANAPSHVSAVLSGVMIKTGIYGIVRVVSLIDAPPMWWGQMLFAVGVVSAVFGIGFAIAQSDLKRLLAYSSVENVGIVAMGLGVAVMGRALGQPVMVLLGFAGALFHVWNHGLFKSLLFMGAGAVVHATGTRRIDVLGGLARKMPRTAVLFLVGLVAVCGLPPLNGFVSELFIYLGMLRGGLSASGSTWFISAAGAPALALVGALALASFVRLFGIVFLGEPRGECVANAHESPREMLAPMSAIAALCVGLGIVGFAVAPLLERAVAVAFPTVHCGRLVRESPLFAVTACTFFLGALLAGSTWLLVKRLRDTPRAKGLTWDCGYVQPTPRLQYTGTSFADLLVQLFNWMLHPRDARPTLAGPFPANATFASETPDLVLDRVVAPVSRGFGWFFARARFVQQGSTQTYLLYIVIAVVVLLRWS